MASSGPGHMRKMKSSLLSVQSRQNLRDGVTSLEQLFDRDVATPASYRGSLKKSRNAASKYDVIDEMANALLESSTDDQAVSSDNSENMHAETWHPTDSHHSQLRYRVDKSSPTSRRSPTGRHSRGNSTSSQKRGAGFMTRPLPRSQTVAVNPLGLHPTQLSSATTVNLAALAMLEGREPPSEVEEERGQRPPPLQDLDVNRKVEMMLAATDALKPPKTQQLASTAGPSPSVMARLKANKVFAKVASAFQSKSSPGDSGNKSWASYSTPDAGSRKRLPALARRPVERHSVEHPRPQELGKSPPTAAREIRKNESFNLINEKVQKITGGPLPRDPSAEDEGSPSRDSALDDPFSDPSPLTRTPTQFECKLRNSPGSNWSSTPSLPSVNPFETEKIMESNVDSLLGSSPLGASTPCAEVRRCGGTGGVSAKKVDDALKTSLLTRVSSEALPTRLRCPPKSPQTKAAGKAKRVVESEPSSTRIAVATTPPSPPRWRKNRPTFDILPSPAKYYEMYKPYETACKNSVPFSRFAASREAKCTTSSASQEPPTSTGGNGCSPDDAAQASRGPRSPVSTKKHPSPDTRQLERLEKSFRKYSAALTGGATEDADELAADVGGGVKPSKTASTLPGHNANQVLGNLASQESYRIKDPLTRSRTDCQLASSPFSTDELQWDAPQYRIGQAARVH